MLLKHLDLHFQKKNVMIESIMRQSIVTNVVITSKCQFSCVTGLVRKNASGGVGAFRAPFSEKKVMAGSIMLQSIVKVCCQNLFI